MSSRLIPFLGILVLLASCQPVTPQGTPAAQELWQILYTPSLRWLGKSLNECTLELPGIGLRVSEVPVQPMDAAGTDFSFKWGEPTAGAINSMLGPVAWTLIVHPTNPAQEIGLADLERVFRGDAVDWKDLKTCKGCASSGGKITPYLYAIGDDARYGFDLLMPGLPARPTTALLAPDAQAVTEAVRSDYSAIGFVPAPLAGSGLKRLAINGLSAQGWKTPIAAMAKSPFDPRKNSWLLCLQSKLNN